MPHTRQQHSKSAPAVRLENASLLRGGRTVWENLTLSVKPGELVAILGPNGSGKTTVLKVLMGLVPLTQGTVAVFGNEPAAERHHIGYIPQQKPFDPDIAIRGRDLVEFGVLGNQYGVSLASSQVTARVNDLIRDVGAADYADAPLGLLSGGEQQRLRIAQALVTNPPLLLCDEPFLSLDIAAQQTVGELIEARKAAGAAVILVTHDLNASILPIVDTVLYLANGKAVIGKPDTVLTSAKLTELYGTPVEVIHAGGRILVLPSEPAMLSGEHRKAAHAH